jgi:hypothetical protein
VKDVDDEAEEMVARAVDGHKLRGGVILVYMRVDGMGMAAAFPEDAGDVATKDLAAILDVAADRLRGRT